MHIQNNVKINTAQSNIDNIEKSLNTQGLSLNKIIHFYLDDLNHNNTPKLTNLIDLSQLIPFDYIGSSSTTPFDLNFIMNENDYYRAIYNIDALNPKQQDSLGSKDSYFYNHILPIIIKKLSQGQSPDREWTDTEWNHLMTIKFHDVVSHEDYTWGQGEATDWSKYPTHKDEPFKSHHEKTIKDLTLAGELPWRNNP